MSKHTIPTEIINKILSYLASKPFTEVAALIQEVQMKAVPVEEKEKNEVSISQ